LSGRHPPCAGKTLCGEDKLPFWGTVSSVCGEDPSRNAIRFPVTRVPASATVALHSKVLHSLHGRMSSGPPQPYFVEILRRGGNPAAGGKRKPHLRVWRRWGRVWLDHQGVERSVSLVCGIPCVWEKSDHGRIVALLSGILRVWEELMSKKMLFSISKRYPPVRGEDGRRFLYLAFHRAVSSCARGRPFQKCGSFSRYKGSRFNDCRLA
jgi:hypothetical protein